MAYISRQGILLKKRKYSSHAVLCIIFKSGKECTRREDYNIELITICFIRLGNNNKYERKRGRIHGKVIN